jgi:hypothetical protein
LTLFNEDVKWLQLNSSIFWERILIRATSGGSCSRTWNENEREKMRDEWVYTRARHGVLYLEWRLEHIRHGAYAFMIGLLSAIASTGSVLHVKSYVLSPWQTLIVTAVCAPLAVFFGVMGLPKLRDGYGPEPIAQALGIIGFCLAAAGLLVNGAQLLFNL